MHRRFVGLILGAVLLASCGSDATPSEDSDAASTASEPVVAEGSGLEQQYEGTFQSPPSSAPAPAQDLNVWAISCGEQITYCAFTAAGAKEAAEALGWEMTVFDSKADPAEAGNGIRQAIAAKADAIVVWLLDCAAARAPFEEAKGAGVTLIAVESLDCDVSDSSQEPVFDASVSYVEGDFATWIGAYGKYQADWIIEKTGGNANALAFITREALATSIQTDGFLSQMETCSGCSVTEIEITFAEIGTSLQAKAEQTLVKYPTADSIWVPLDGVITGGVGTALESANRGDMHVMGAEGLSPAPDLARIGVQQDAGVGFVPTWEGYAAIDALIRFEAGEPVVSSGIGLQIWDRDNNLPPEGESYEAPIDFESAYREAWGLA